MRAWLGMWGRGLGGGLRGEVSGVWERDQEIASGLDGRGIE